MEAAKIIRERNVSGAPVLNEDGDIVGVLSEADIIGLTSTISLPDIELNPSIPSCS